MLLTDVRLEDWLKQPDEALLPYKPRETRLFKRPSRLTLRRDRGGAYDPPLEVNRKQLKNRGPEAHQIFFLLLKFGSAIFGTIRWPVGVTGGHRWPPDALWPYTRPKFQSSSIFIKLDT